MRFENQLLNTVHGLTYAVLTFYKRGMYCIAYMLTHMYNFNGV